MIIARFPFPAYEPAASIYGATWDGTAATTWTRTDGAADFANPEPYVAGAASYGSPFDNIMPWAGMVRSTDANAGEVVAIPKFWYELKQLDNGGMSIRIADRETDGFVVSPAHMDRGDGNGEKDVIYVGRYHCDSTFKSVSGVLPKVRMTRANFRTNIHNLNSNIWQWDFATRFTIWLLYLVEFADWNSQNTIGFGGGNGSSTGTVNMGYTDSMPYHTGTTLASRSTYGASTQYRNIEGLWDNVYDWLDGCYNSSAGLNIITNPSSFSDTAGGTSVGTPKHGYPSAFTVSNAGGYPMFYVSATGGSDSTFSCDSWNFDASHPTAYSGGCYGQSMSFGMFYLYLHATATYTHEAVGSRLMILP